jgi:hypothetical protein
VLTPHNCDGNAMCQLPYVDAVQVDSCHFVRLSYHQGLSCMINSPQICCLPQLPGHLHDSEALGCRLIPTPLIA